jgi:hypothetical protein
MKMATALLTLTSLNTLAQNTALTTQVGAQESLVASMATDDVSVVRDLMVPGFLYVEERVYNAKDTRDGIAEYHINGYTVGEKQSRVLSQTPYFWRVRC